jgi:hypothetical protein
MRERLGLRSGVSSGSVPLHASAEAVCSERNDRDSVLGERVRMRQRSDNAEVLSRAARRDWSVTRRAIRELLDERRSEP